MRNSSRHLRNVCVDVKCVRVWVVLTVWGHTAILEPQVIKCKRVLRRRHLGEACILISIVNCQKQTTCQDKNSIFSSLSTISILSKCIWDQEELQPGFRNALAFLGQWYLWCFLSRLCYDAKGCEFPSLSERNFHSITFLTTALQYVYFIYTSPNSHIKYLKKNPV